MIFGKSEDFIILFLLLLFVIIPNPIFLFKNLLLFIKEGGGLLSLGWKIYRITKIDNPRKNAQFG